MKMKTILLALGVACTAATAATFTVTSTDDSGPETFRQALLDVNSSPGPHLIEFNIPGDGPHVIAPGSPLPWVSQTVTIDGYSQPGASPNTLADGFDAQTTTIQHPNTSYEN